MPIKSIVNGVEKEITRIPMLSNGTYKETWEVRDNLDHILWGRNETLTGVSSISYKGYGLPLKGMEVKGNGVQNGTPSPTNIVPFDGVGNLLNVFNKDTADITPHSGLDVNNSRWIYNAVEAARVLRIPCKPNTQYSLSYTLSQIPPEYGTSFIRIAVTTYDTKPSSSSYVNTTTLVSNSYSETGYKTMTFTTRSDSKYILIQTNGEYTIFDDMVNSLMLVYGSTAYPYEPYSFRVPVTNNSVTTRIDLSQTPALKKIQKRVLTGDENWDDTSGVTMVHDIFNANPFIPAVTGISDRYVYNAIQSGIAAGLANGEFALQKSSGSYNLAIKDSRYSSASNFKSYLASQYAAGTPVTIWYVLAEPITGIVNEPLLKIGSYADELTIDPGITPQTGTNTLTVDTTLSPSSISITGHIKSLA